jgi:hypothetical protein
MNYNNDRMTVAGGNRSATGRKINGSNDNNNNNNNNNSINNNNNNST